VVEQVELKLKVKESQECFLAYIDHYGPIEVAKKRRGEA